MGLNTLTNLAGSGAFGSTAQKYSAVIQPPNPIAAPNPAPPPPPVSGQQGVNPAATPSSGFAAHFQANWGKYAIGLGAVVLLVVGVSAARR